MICPGIGNGSRKAPAGDNGLELTWLLMKLISLLPASKSIQVMPGRTLFVVNLNLMTHREKGLSSEYEMISVP